VDDRGLRLEGVEDAFPLAPAQEGMLYHTLAAPGRGVYVGVVDAILPAGLDLEAFRAAWGEVVARHQALRTQFVWDGLDAPVQVVRDAVDLPLGEAAQQPSEDWIETLRREDLDLSRAPAFRLCLMPRRDGRRHLAWVCHHSLIDDWSAGVVLQEVAALYAARIGGPAAALPPAMPFRDFVDWQAGRDAAADDDFWRATLEGFREPSHVEHLKGEGSGHGRLDTRLPAAATARLEDVARRLRVPLADVIAAAWAVIVHRLSGVDDVVFGQAVTLRPPELPGIETAVGNFVATLPIRARLDAHPTLRALILARNADGLAARGHSAAPLGRIQELSGLPPGVPLFDTILSMESQHPAEVGVAGRTVFESIATRDTSHYPLAVLVCPGRELAVRLQFDRRHHDPARMRAVRDMLATALSALPDRLDDLPTHLDVMNAAELGRASAGFRNTVAVPPFRPVHEEFAAAATRTPEAVAVSGTDGVVTYGALDRRSAAWAGALAARGLGPGDRVALLLERGPLVAVAMLAALRAGTAYVPFDAGHASDRTREALRACGAAAVLTDAAGAALLADEGVPVLRIDWEPPQERAAPRSAGPDDVAYVMYTSGSTSVPKGVVVTHGNLASSTAARLAFYDLPPRAFLLLPSFAFDSSVAGIYWTLCTGGTLVVPPSGALRDVTTLAATIADAQATHVLCLPSLLDVIADHARPDALSSLAVVIAAGEPLTGATVQRCRRSFVNARIYNEYGPTEATVWCAACEVTGQPDGPVPIGGPIPGGRLVIRDGRDRPVPDGLPGELLVGGPGVAAGYLDRPDATAARFVDGPDDTRLYRTGDVVRLRPDGMLDYLGRSDEQVKIRGHRVEPAEIEAVLAARTDVREAAVIPHHGPAGTRLAAYVVPGTRAPNADTLRAHMRRVLPDWMVPHHVAVLDALPRTATGKLDRNALPPVDETGASETVAPRTPLERQLAAIWRRILSLDREIGIDEDFRELGGHSLLSIRLVSAIESEVGLRLPLAAAGNITTLAEQAALLETVASAPTPGPSPGSVDATDPFAGLSEDELRAMHAYLAGWPGEPAFPGSLFRSLNREGDLPPLVWCFNGGEEFAALADTIGPDQPLIGLRSGNLVLDLSPETQQRNNRRLAVQALPELLRIQPAGPVCLGGNCQGAAVAMELALALQGLGRSVAIVFLMETVPMHAFHGRAAVILGRDSEYNPFTEFAEPERAWARRYLRHSVDMVSGGHGDFFDEPNVRELADAVTRRLAEARAETPTYLTDADRRVAWTAPGPIGPFAPGETRALSVRARNAGPATWQATPESGLRLVARWVGPDAAVRPGGHADILAPWQPGDVREMSPSVTAPRQAGVATLEIDMVEEGVARFSASGSPPLRVEIRVDPARGPAAPTVSEPPGSDVHAPEPAIGDLASLLDEARAANWKGAYDTAAAMLADTGGAAPALFAELGRAQAATGDPAAAERSFRQALALDPACADALFGLGRIRLEAGRPLAALLAFRRGLRIRDDAEVRYLAGRAAHRLNLPLRALGRLRREARRLGAGS